MSSPVPGNPASCRQLRSVDCGATDGKRGREGGRWKFSVGERCCRGEDGKRRGRRRRKRRKIETNTLSCIEKAEKRGVSVPFRAAHNTDAR